MGKEAGESAFSRLIARAVPTNGVTLTPTNLTACAATGTARPSLLVIFRRCIRNRL